MEKEGKGNVARNVFYIDRSLTNEQNQVNSSEFSKANSSNSLLD